MRAFRKRLRHTAGHGLRRSPIAVQDAIRPGSHTLLAALGLEGGNSRPATGIRPVAESPPVPLPEGVSLPDLERTYYSWSVNGEPVGHADGYVGDSIRRVSAHLGHRAG